MPIRNIFVCYTSCYIKHNDCALSCNKFCFKIFKNAKNFLKPGTPKIWLCCLYQHMLPTCYFSKQHENLPNNEHFLLHLNTQKVVFMTSQRAVAALRSMIYTKTARNFFWKKNKNLWFTVTKVSPSWTKMVAITACAFCTFSKAFWNFQEALRVKIPWI